MYIYIYISEIQASITEFPINIAIWGARPIVMGNHNFIHCWLWYMPTPKRIEKGFQDGTGHVSNLFFQVPNFSIFLGGCYL